MCAGGMNVLGTARSDIGTEKENNGQATALTYCIQRGLSFGGAVVRTVYVTASKQG